MLTFQKAFDNPLLKIIFEYLENEKNSLDEIKNIFHRAIIW